MPAVYRTEWFLANVIALDNVDNDVRDWVTNEKYGTYKLFQVKPEKVEQYLEIERSALPDYKRIQLSHFHWIVSYKGKRRPETARVIVKGLTHCVLAFLVRYQAYEVTINDHTGNDPDRLSASCTYWED